MKWILSFAFLGSVALTGCSTTDNIGNCHAICDRYQDCFDKSYDTSKCYDNCRSQSDSDKNFEHDVSVCHACIDGQSCTDSAFMCTGDCGGIVP